MKDKEIQLFTEALKKASEEFYIEAIPLLEQLIYEFPDSELIHDAYYDIGLCYFNINQFEKALEYFNTVMKEFPYAKITEHTGKNEFGYTAAKSLFAIINCHLGMGNPDLAVKTYEEFDKYPHSYVIDESGNKQTFKELAKQALKVYNEQVKK